MSSFARMLCNHFLVTWLAGCLRPIFGGLITGARGLFIKTIRWSITVGVELWSEQSLIYVRVTTRYTKISSKPGYPLTSVTKVCSHVGGVTWQEGHVNHESTTVNFPVINESMCWCVMVVWAALKLSRLVLPVVQTEDCSRNKYCKESTQIQQHTQISGMCTQSRFNKRPCCSPGLNPCDRTK